MENIIGLRKANCKDCYKCIRNCPVKSISYRDEQVNILDSECIYCGTCLMVCPQNAKYIYSDLPKVKEAIKAGEKLYVSVAPSYIAAFKNSNILNLSAALKKLGFSHVEETAIGAEQVTREYVKLIEKHKMKNIITTACPSINLLIEKYYPELIDQMAPVVTPVVAHARMIKQIYGPRAKVVFIGPCISKKYECNDPENGKALFAVLNFKELSEWMAEEHVEIGDLDHEARTIVNTMPRFFPAPGGIIRNLGRDERRVYECLSVDGVDRCIEILNSIVEHQFSGYFLELNACSGGCLGGPVLKTMGNSYLFSKNELVKNVKRVNEALPALTIDSKAKFTHTFHNRSIRVEQIDEESIREVLASIGKTSPEDEINCGCCGYNSCREKAIAVLQNKADIHMCVPYMKGLAESMSNTVVENIPNGVLILDDKLNIQHINPFAISLLHITDDVKNSTIESVLKSGDFIKVLHTGENILNHKIAYHDLDIVVEQSVIFVKDSRTMFVLLNDVTHQEQMLKDHRKSVEETAAFAQSVINKQIHVVQEIAGLLGETTTETKVALSKLINSVVLPKGVNDETED